MLQRARARANGRSNEKLSGDWTKIRLVLKGLRYSDALVIIFRDFLQCVHTVVASDSRIPHDSRRREQRDIRSRMPAVGCTRERRVKSDYSIIYNNRERERCKIRP